MEARQVDSGLRHQGGQVGYELELREKVKRAGGIWRPRQQLWELPYGQILALGLEDRIVEDRI